MPGTTRSAGKVYLSIVQGSLRQRVEEGTPGAIKREFENKKDNTKGEKWEIIYSEWLGTLQQLKVIEDDQYGQKLAVEFEDAIINIPTDSKYFQTLMQKLPCADLTLPISVHPYDFEKGGDKFKGISVSQRGVKLKSYYYDEAGKAINGYPVPEGDVKTFNSDDWKIFFLRVKKFLLGQLPGLQALLTPQIAQVEDELETPEDNTLDLENMKQETIAKTDLPTSDASEVRIEDVPF